VAGIGQEMMIVELSEGAIVLSRRLPLTSRSQEAFIGDRAPGRGRFFG
jgi:hypothetical protein